MTSLITWAQYQAITGAPDADETVAEEVGIPAASEAVERYCDRTFSAGTSIEWSSDVAYYGNWFVRRYPITQVLSAYDIVDGIKCVNSEAYDITLVVDSTGITAVNPATLAVVQYPFATYATVTQVAGALTVGAFVASVEASLYSSTKSTLIKPGTYLVAAGETAYLPVGVPSSAKPRWTESQISRLDAYAVAYTGGYATLPSDLIMVIALVAQSVIAGANGSGATAGVKSESIGKYSYTLADGVDSTSLVSPYAEALAPWRRLVVA